VSVNNKEKHGGQKETHNFLSGNILSAPEGSLPKKTVLPVASIFVCAGHVWNEDSNISCYCLCSFAVPKMLTANRFMAFLNSGYGIHTTVRSITRVACKELTLFHTHTHTHIYIYMFKI